LKSKFRRLLPLTIEEKNTHKQINEENGTMRNIKQITFFITLLAIVVGQTNRDEVVQITFPTEGVTVMTDSIDVTFTLASFFDIDSVGCLDCDGYLKVYLNGYYNSSVTAVGPVPISNLYEGTYQLKLEAVDPSGNSFNPAAFDTVNFNVDLPSVDNLCVPTGFSLIAGDARNFLSWNKPIDASSENPFPASPGSADYHTGSATNAGFTETSAIKADAGSSTSRQSGWIRFDLAGMVPFVSVDTIIFNYYVNATNWPYWNVTPISVDPLSGDAGALHADINTGITATESYLYQSESATFSPGQYSNVLINSANTDLAAAIQQGYFAMGIVDRDASGTYHVYLDGWNDANPPSLEIHWSIGDSRGVHRAEAISNDIPYSDNEIFTYKQAMSQNLDISDYLMGIKEFEQESTPNMNYNSREVIDGCGDLQNYIIYNSVGTVVDSVVDTTAYIHENLTNDAEYCYYVVANYTGGESDVSETLCATPEAFVANPPTNIRGTALDEAAFLAWTVPGTPNYVYYESFDNGIPADWTIVNLNDDEYTWASPHANSNAVLSGFGDALYAICDSDDAPSDVAMDEELITGSFNFSTIATPYLSFLTFYNDLTTGDNSDFAAVDVSTDGGTTWTNMFTWDADIGSSTAPSNEIVDLTSVAGDSSNVKIRFHYNDNNSWAWFWAIDNIIIYDSDPTADAFTSRATDGDFLHYQVISNNSVIADSISGNNTIVTGLTNGVAYTLGVTALYYPFYKSDTIEVVVTPTWMYGDISGTVYGPDGTTAMDSAIVSVGSKRDTTGTDGAYSIMDLDPGTYTVTVSRSGFDGEVADVTVIAQEAATVQDFTILPILGKPAALNAEPGDGEVDLTWMTPGASLPGDWVFYHDGTFENGYGSTSGGAGLGTLFTPSGYPATVTAVRFHVSTGGTPTDDIEVYVFADDGVTELSGPYTVPGVSDDFIEVDIDDFTIESGGFLVATYNVGTDGPYVSVDEDSYNGTLYFGNATGGWTEMGAGYGIFATGSHEALISSSSGLTVIIGSESISRPQGNRNEAVSGEFAMLSHPTNDVIKELYLGSNGEENLEVVLNTHPSNSANYRTSREDSLAGYNIYEIRSSGDTLIGNNGPGDTTYTVTGLANYSDYCYAVKAIWDTDDFDTLESKYSVEVCAKPYKLGDVDFDNDVDIVDIPTIVDFALGTDSPSDEEFRAADINDDRMINIQDIVMTVDIIFGTSSSRTIAFDPSATAGVSLGHSSGALAVNVSYESISRGFQFTVSYDPNQLTFGSPVLNASTDGMMLQHLDDGEGNYMVVALDLNGGGLDMKDGAFVTLPISMANDASAGTDVALSKVMISGPGGISIPVRDEGSSLKIEVLPMVYALHQNYPNPFNPVTEIRFDLPETAPVTLTVFNIMGKEVRTLVTEDLSAGFHSVSWNGLNDAGSPVSTGMYFYTISAGTYHATKKMVLLK
jgi:hypothetical protein